MANPKGAELRFLLVLILLMTAGISQCACAGDIVRSTLFRAGEGAYNNYRIPAMIRTKSNAMLAFCEGRQTPHGPGNDSGEINIIMRRSSDGGATFDASRVVWADGKNTCGNPCPVIDQTTGAIWLLMTHNLGEDHEDQIIAGTSKGTRTVWITRSDDDGLTWLPPREITASVKKPQWHWFATGPGVGIQIQNGNHVGRLVIPCDFVAKGGGADHSNSLVIYSDDHGATWSAGESPPKGRFNECQVVELEGGRLSLNMRNTPSPAGELPRTNRAIAISKDGGATFGEAHPDPALIEPRCQASILRYSWPSMSDASKPSRILFSDPASRAHRSALTVRMSYDDAQTWPIEKQIFGGWSGYSCLVTTADGAIGLLYEAGDHEKYERIDFARFDLNWLADGKDPSGLATTTTATTAPTTTPAQTWTRVADLPDSNGVAGAFVGETNSVVLLAGGSNFPKAPPWRGGEKVCYPAIHLLAPNPSHEGALEWKRNVVNLPHPASYGVSITTERGIIMIGGCDTARCYADVIRVSWTPDKGVVIDILPPLPKPLAYMTGALAGDRIVIAGGQETIDNPRATNHCFTLNLSEEGKPGFAWREEKPWPGPPRILAQSAALLKDGHPIFYLFSGRNPQPGRSTDLLTDAHRFDARTRRWETLPPIQLGDDEPLCVMAGSALVKGTQEILLLGGDPGPMFKSLEHIRRQIADAKDPLQKQKVQADLDRAMETHPGFPGAVICYDTQSRTYSKCLSLPAPAPLTTTCIWWNKRILVPSGEIRPGVRTPTVWLSPREMDCPP